jgi:hypothetical protein
MRVLDSDRLCIVVNWIRLRSKAESRLDSNDLGLYQCLKHGPGLCSGLKANSQSCKLICEKPSLRLAIQNREANSLLFSLRLFHSETFLFNSSFSLVLSGLPLLCVGFAVQRKKVVVCGEPKKSLWRAIFESASACAYLISTMYCNLLAFFPFLALILFFSHFKLRFWCLRSWALGTNEFRALTHSLMNRFRAKNQIVFLTSHSA